MSNKIEMVRVYDFETNKATSIPACELAPGMLRVQIRGFEGEFWVDASQLKLEFLSEALNDVYPQQVPNQENATWENILNAFLHFTNDVQLSFEERKEMFTVIFLACTNGPENVLHTFTPGALSKQQVGRILGECGDYIDASLAPKK